MKRGRNTLILLVLAAELGAYIYFVESKREPAPTSDEPTSTAAKLFTIEPDKIEEVSIKGTAGDQTTLRKTGGNWQVIAPVQVAADATEASGLATSLASLEEQRVIEENPKDLTPYGLTKPRIEIGFQAAGDKEPRRLLLGDKTATGGELYAKLADKPKVFLVSSYLEGSFDKSTFQLREKTVLKFDREKVDAITVEHNKATVQLARQNDAWLVKEPWSGRADFGTIESLLSRLSTGQMKAIASQEPTSLREYGLDAPATRVAVAAGSTTATLLLGKATPEGDVYAKDLARPMVFTVEKALADDVGKAPADYRLKDVFAFRAYSGTRLEVARNGGATLAFEKKKGPEKDAVEAWTMVQPAKKVEASTIEDLAGKVAGLRAESFAESLPKGAVELARITAKFDEGKKEETVTLYSAGADVYAVRSDEAGAAKLPKADVDAMFAALDGL